MKKYNPLKKNNSTIRFALQYAFVCMNYNNLRSELNNYTVLYKQRIL